ncbi:MAG: ROK family protein [Pirellulaceae bacterium]
MSYFVGVDVGGTTTTIAIGDGDRNILHVSPQFETRSAEGPQATISAIVQEILAGLKSLGISPIDVAQIGLATPGPATLDGVLNNTPNLNPELWNNFAARQTLQEAMQLVAKDVAVHYIGDGQAAALGEYSIRNEMVVWSKAQLDKSSDKSSGQNLMSLFMVIVGTGLGGGAVQNGGPVRGSQGRAGHAGHIFLPADAFRYEHDRQLRVGNAVSTVESAVSLTALTHQLGFRLGLDQWQEHPLKSAPGSMREKAKQLRELAANGDELALELFDDQARALGIGLLAVNYVGDYDLLVIGGGVCDLTSELKTRYKATAENAYRESSLDGFRNLEHIEFSLCGDEAAVVGALAHAYASDVQQ